MGSGGAAPLLTSSLGGERPASCPDRLPPEKKVHGTRQKGGLVGPREGLDSMENRKTLPPPGIEPHPSLYRLSYRSSLNL
jgi:hypothetical protein